MKQFNYLKWQSVSEQTYVLSLDPKFDPFKEKKYLFYLKHELFDFRGGEPSIKISGDGIAPDKLIITQRYNQVHDLMAIILAADAARRMGFKEISLILPYFPAARQDRVCDEGESLTVKVFADMINSCGFDSVVILSPHSEVTPALLNNVVVLDELKFVEQIILSIPEPAFNIVCPDAGAGKRVGKVVEHLSKVFPEKVFNLIRCEKIRNVKDGKLEGFFVQADDLGHFPTIIVDDINSMGGTFIGLGEKLKEKNCGTLSLFTSHSDCYAGIKNVSENFDKVYTTNSKRDWTTDFFFPLDSRVECFEIKI